MKISVKVPATTANLGPGFDTLGMALNLYNVVSLEEIDYGFEMVVTGEGQEWVPRSTDNTVYRAVKAVYDRLGRRRPGMRLQIHNNVPVTRGLGSSATAIVGGLVVANEACQRSLSTEELLEMAIAIEGHPDNVAPALFGGFVVCGSIDGKAWYQKFIPPKELRCIVAVPDFQLATSVSRNVLPSIVPFHDAVGNLNRSSLLVSAMATGNLELFSRAMQDKLHQPYRMRLVPGMERAAEAAKTAGALSVALSGSGPSLIAFCTEHEEAIGAAMVDTFDQSGVTSHVHYLSPDTEGVHVSEAS